MEQKKKLSLQGFQRAMEKERVPYLRVDHVCCVGKKGSPEYKTLVRVQLGDVEFVVPKTSVVWLSE